MCFDGSIDLETSNRIQFLYMTYMYKDWIPRVLLMFWEFAELLVYVGFAYASDLSLKRPPLKQNIYRLSGFHFSERDFIFFMLDVFEGHFCETWKGFFGLQGFKTYFPILSLRSLWWPLWKGFVKSPGKAYIIV